MHAELTLGRGIEVGHGQVELLMLRAGLQGLGGRPKWRRVKPKNVAADLVKRDFNGFRRCVVVSGNRRRRSGAGQIDSRASRRLSARRSRGSGSGRRFVVHVNAASTAPVHVRASPGPSSRPRGTN